MEMGELERKLRDNAVAEFHADVVRELCGAFDRLQVKYGQGLNLVYELDNYTLTAEALAVDLSRQNAEYVQTLAIDEALRRLSSNGKSRAVAQYNPPTTAMDSDEDEEPAVKARRFR